MSGARLHTLLPELTSRQPVMVVGAAVIDVIADAYALPWRGCDIELKQQSVNVGGCALNIAVALKRLGIEAGNALPLGQGVWAEIIRNRMAKAGIAASLKKSGLEYFDLYLLHQAMGDYFSAWRALEEAYEAGTLKAIGVSNFYPHVLANFCETVRIKPMVNQVELHPYFAQPAALEAMKHYHVQPEAWAPLGGGRHNPYQDALLRGIADAHQKTIAQVVLRWNVQRGVTVIPKSTRQERIEENFAIWDFVLTDNEMAQISALDLGYVGEAVKHFNPEFVRGCLGVKIHD